MRLRYSALREAGSYAIESCTEHHDTGRFFPLTWETVSCFVVYADRGLPSHSVRIFEYREDA